MKPFRSRFPWQAILGLAAWLAVGPALRAQTRGQAYIGFVYPAGGQQGTTFQVTVGGQELDGVSRIFVSGAGVQARVVEYNKKLATQAIGLLNEQLKELRRGKTAPPDKDRTNLIARIEKVLRSQVIQPQNAAIADLAVAEVTIAPDAVPGQRELRLGTPRALSNPLVFYVGQLPEVSAPPAPTSPKQILGKEEQALRKKKGAGGKRKGDADMMMMTGGTESQSDFDEAEVRINLPCILNGQISSGAVNRYRFEARRGQRLVMVVQARALVPYMADAVPGWFQPVLELRDAKSEEVAYNDDYRFKPDPVICYEIPEDGDYVLGIHDALYRGREDFVYRISIGELPFVTSCFPLGGRAGTPTAVELKGWNLLENRLTPDTPNAGPGIYPFTARGTNGLVSNPLLFAVDALPECLEKEPNNTPEDAQNVTLPIMVNGRIDPPDSPDVFRVEGHEGDKVVAEVYARRLDSPLDSVLKLTDASGQCLAFNDDYEDLGSGLNTHHADSYLQATLPSNGMYYIYLNDTQHRGGEEYAYRLRVSPPQPDFALRVTPSSISLRPKSAGSLSVYAIRKDGFTGAIKLDLKDAPGGFTVKGQLTATQELTRISVQTSLRETQDPVTLIIEGSSTNGDQKIVREAVPAEDRMQAFLWRHLVPARELKAVVFIPPPSPKFEAAKKQTPPAPSKPEPPKQPAPSTPSNPEPPKQPAPPVAAKP